VNGERGSPGGSGRPKFPALDPEPPPSARRRQIAIRLGASIAAAALVAAGLQLTVLQQHAAAAHRKSIAARYLSAAPAARILSITPKLYLALSNLRQGKPTTLRALGEMTTAPIPSLDGRYLFTPYGQVISLQAAGGPATLPTKLNMNGFQETAPYSPFADHDRYGVVLDSSAGFGSTENPISVQALATGRSASLGTGDNVAGDPAGPGVFTSVAAAIRPTSQATTMFPDGELQVRDAGRARVTIATIKQIDRDVLLAPGSQAALIPYPDPAGDKVAIAVEPTAAGQRAGVVVMTRTGHVIRTFTGLSGVITPAWSQSGQALAFATSGPAPVLHIWGGGSTTARVRLPVAQYGSCVWSADATWVLCPAEGPAGTGQQWFLSSASGATTVRTTGPGFPIAWLGGK
jgi:hypothetical protein